MALSARTLSVRNFRSYEEFTLELDAGVTVLAGPNAAGKTNLVEALQILTAGRSFRTTSPAPLVRAGETRASAELLVEGDGRRVDLGWRAETDVVAAAGNLAVKRTFTRNGKNVTVAGMRGVLPSVLFYPDHLDIVKRAAVERRSALDEFGVQLSESYAQLLGAYRKTLEQRNSLLRGGFADPVLLSSWDEALISAGISVMRHRAALLERVRGHFHRVYAAISGGEEADAVYEPSVPLAVPVTEASADDLEEAFRAALAAHRGEDLARGHTSVGPQRDDVAMSIAGLPARTFASQGQQRSLVLAWKIAEVEVVRDILGRPPLLLLDDVMSELDADRRRAVMRFVQEGIQTVITTTNLGYFEGDVLDRAKVVRVGGE